jgi:hypothetical protein
MVDAALESGDRDTARHLLSLEGGHGRITGHDDGASDDGCEVGDGSGGGGGGGDACGGRSGETCGGSHRGGRSRAKFTWLVDAATHPWQQGLPCGDLAGPAPSVSGWAGLGMGRPAFLGATVTLGGATWDVLECSFPTAQALAEFLSHSVKETSVDRKLDIMGKL